VDRRRRAVVAVQEPLGHEDRRGKRPLMAAVVPFAPSQRDTTMMIHLRSAAQHPTPASRSAQVRNAFVNSREHSSLAGEAVPIP
jgi:hypothetical protein